MSGSSEEKEKAVNLGSHRGLTGGREGESGILGTSRKEQEHSLSPQVSDILTPAAPQVPHLPLLLHSSPRRVWNQRDQQDQGHSFQAGHDLGTGGPGKLSATCPCGPEMLG